MATNASTRVRLDDVLKVVDAIIQQERAAHGSAHPKADYEARVESYHRHDEATEVGRKLKAALASLAV